ncbi:cupin domain-containing protein [Geobacter sp.]|uniref:cupin domain-containing protein n=1 Tax=Geobacter sp. TaxID=46610 RepID=UPI0026285ACC|nr:cupin domain-containing protein [Geobacter sp.]
MKSQVLDVQKLKKFDDQKRYQETLWSDDHARVSLICMKPGQEIITHTHHGSHIWTVMEGTGEFLTGKEPRTITVGQIVIVPPFENHGIRNTSQENLVIASITAQGD